MSEHMPKTIKVWEKEKNHYSRRALCDRAYLIENGIVAKRGGKDLVREYFVDDGGDFLRPPL